MLKEDKTFQHLGCEIFCNLKSCKPALPLSPGKGEEKTCPFWAASRNSANVGGRLRPKLVVAVSRDVPCVCVHARSLRGQSFEMEIWSDVQQRARLPNWPDNGPSVRPAALLSSCYALPTFIWTCFYTSLVPVTYMKPNFFCLHFQCSGLQHSSSLNIIL